MSQCLKTLFWSFNFRTNVCNVFFFVFFFLFFCCCFLLLFFLLSIGLVFFFFFFFFLDYTFRKVRNRMKLSTYCLQISGNLLLYKLFRFSRRIKKKVEHELVNFCFGIQYIDVLDSVAFFGILNYAYILGIFDNRNCS